MGEYLFGEASWRRAVKKDSAVQCVNAVKMTILRNCFKAARAPSRML
jgi:hypothetical protein